MDMKLRKGMAAALAVCVLGSTAGCNREEPIDTSAIETIPARFIDALATDNASAMISITRDYDYAEDTEGIRLGMGDYYDLFEHFVSLTEITEFGEIVLDEVEEGQEQTAEVDVTFSYVDTARLVSSFPNEYRTRDQLIEDLDSCADRKEKTFTLEFVRNEITGDWFMYKQSAEKITDLLWGRMRELPYPVEISPEEARANFEQFIDDLATQGHTDLNVGLEESDIRVYDPIVTRGHGSQTQAAVDSFVQAYYTYILDHDHEIEEVEPYHYILHGSAPSNTELSAAINTDDFLAEFYSNFVRYHTWIDTSYLDEVMWDRQSALIYDTLTEAVEDCSEEDFDLEVEAYAYGSVETLFGIEGEVIIVPAVSIYEVEHSVNWTRMESCMTEALDRLLANGEISETEYDAWIRDLTPENYGYSESDSSVSSLGHPDQAVGTYEQVPEWCEDESIVYGYSYPDQFGVWMFYSKEPGYLDTVAYYIDASGIWVTNYFDCDFDAGTDLEVDWWIDGEQVVDAEYYTVEEDGTTEVEVFLPIDHPYDIDECEMRLWLPGHSHVISYVTLTVS